MFISFVSVWDVAQSGKKADMWWSMEASGLGYLFF